MTAWQARRTPSGGRSSWTGRRGILAVGAALIALGIGKAVLGSGSRLPSPAQAAELRFVARALRGELLHAHSALRAESSTVVRIPASMRVGTIQRIDVRVDAGSTAQARGTARARSGATIAAVEVALTPAGRALLLARTLSHPTALRVSATATGTATATTSSLRVTIPG